MKKGQLGCLPLIVVGALWVQFGFPGTGFIEHLRKSEEIQDQEPRLFYADQDRREYLGGKRYFHGKTEQTVYVDKKPFGNLDEVVTRYSFRGGVHELPSKEPTANEISGFELNLQSYEQK
ncbi:MAG: hypothetical protein AABX03_05240 [Nanoarchaeota archaeon]